MELQQLRGRLHQGEHSTNGWRRREKIIKNCLRNQGRKGGREKKKIRGRSSKNCTKISNSAEVIKVGDHEFIRNFSVSIKQQRQVKLKNRCQVSATRNERQCHNLNNKYPRTCGLHSELSNEFLVSAQVTIFQHIS